MLELYKMANKPDHHPKPAGEYTRPVTINPDYIKGTLGIAGFGNKDFYIAVIPSKLAREIIIKNHYSKRIVNNSYIHLGVFLNGTLCGVLQFGYMLNQTIYGLEKIVRGTRQGEYLELNRMWLDDLAPKNSESKAISYAIKYIKKVFPMVGWIQSFADERCEKLGVVYQAANFLYFGHHKTFFYELNGQTFHSMLLSVRANNPCPRDKYIIDNLAQAKKRSLIQFRYIYFIKRSWIARCKVKPLPYPKPNQPLPNRRIKVNKQKSPS